MLEKYLYAVGRKLPLKQKKDIVEELRSVIMDNLDDIKENKRTAIVFRNIYALREKINMKSIKGHSDALYNVAFSPDGALIASGSFDQTIKLWSTKNGELINTLGHSSSVWFWPVSIMWENRSQNGTSTSFYFWS